jgi:hypothetical protein
LTLQKAIFEGGDAISIFRQRCRCERKQMGTGNPGGNTQRHGDCGQCKYDCPRPPHPGARQQPTSAIAASKTIQSPPEESSRLNIGERVEGDADDHSGYSEVTFLGRAANIG